MGARLPGVIFVAVSRPVRAMLYWHRMYFWAAGLWCCEFKIFCEKRKERRREGRDR